MDKIVELIFHVFKEPTDHIKWDKHIEFANFYECIDPMIKNEWIEALQFLKKALGRDFLKDSDLNHPIKRMVTDKAHWRVTELIAFTKVLQIQKKLDMNYPLLIGKLKSDKKCRPEGIPFAEIIQMFQSVDCKVSVWKDIQAQKNPDLQVFFPDQSEGLIVEVSKIEDSYERSGLDKNYRYLSDIFNNNPPQLPFSCQLFRFINDQEMPEVLKKIFEIRINALNKQEIFYYADNIMRLTVAHPSKIHELVSWEEKNDYRRGLLGPNLNFDETSRIVNNKIEDEANQIPAISSGLIYLPVNVPYFWVINPLNTIGLIEEKLKSFPNLLGIVIYGTICQELKTNTVELNGHFYGIKQINQAIIRHLLFIRNPNYIGNLTESSINKIYLSFQ
jgi:hypothetical protein